MAASLSRLTNEAKRKGVRVRLTKSQPDGRKKGVPTKVSSMPPAARRPIRSAVYIPPAAVSVAAAALFYTILWPIMMQDVGNDYIPWLRHIVDNGIPAAFAAPVGNYNPPFWYLLATVSPLYDVVPAATLIKLISFSGSLALCAAVYHLLRGRVEQPARWAALTLLMPSHMLNTALLGSGDTLWAAPAVTALGCALSRRHAPMLMWCAIALSFKFQAILFAPFVLAVLIRRRVPLHLWLVVPLTYVAMLTPAALLGWPIRALATVYIGQAGWSALLSLNAPNIWFLVQSIVPDIGTALNGLALVSAVGASACYIAWFSVKMPSDDGAVPVALLCLLITAGLLPHMHERYFFLADIVALIAAALSERRDAWRTALLVQAGSALSVWAYATGASWLVDIAAACMILATIRIARPLLRPAANDNPTINGGAWVEGPPQVPVDAMRLVSSSDAA